MGRRMRICLAALIAALALGIALWLWRGVFVVRSIEVRGGGAPVDEVVEASGVKLGQSVFRLNEEEVRAGVDALGVVYLDEYRLRLPDKLDLKVAAREPVAMMRCGEGLLLIDGAGCAVELVEDAPDTDLLYLSGVEVSDCSMGRAIEAADGRAALCREIIAAMEALHAQIYVSEVDLSDVENLRLITRGGILVELGGAENLGEKLALMKAAVADLEAEGAAGGILHLNGAGRADYSPPPPEVLEN